VVVSSRPALPAIDDVLGADEVAESAASIAALQRPSGMIPWYPGGHCDPWNHVETAMALDVAGRHTEAERAYEWLVRVQRPDGSWFNYYLDGDEVEDAKLDTNVCAYLATGVWHHWLITGDLAFVEHLWPTVRRAIDWVLTLQTAQGQILWAREVDELPWQYALLTGSSSICHALDCARRLAALLGVGAPRWDAAQRALERVIRTEPGAFEPKERWAMDWYYPVLCDVVVGRAAEQRLGRSWSTFVMPGRGVRCVSDEPWVTAAETAECAIAHAAVGDKATATQLLDWTRAHRHADGSYWTGLVYPDEVVFPIGERTAYTAAAVILAADAISGTSPASGIFLPSAEGGDGAAQDA
jgi:hypothetical protein